MTETFSPETETFDPGKGNQRALNGAIRWFSVIAWVVGAAGCALLLWSASVPGGAVFSAVLLALLLGFGAFLLLGVVGILLLVQRRFRWSIVALPAVLLATVLITQTDWPQQAHWQFIRADLERAESSGQCPDRVGLVAVHGCRELSGGHTGYDLNGGFLDAVAIAHLGTRAEAEAVAPPSVPMAEAEGAWLLGDDLGDGWWTVHQPF